MPQEFKLGTVYGVLKGVTAQQYTRLSESDFPQHRKNAETRTLELIGCDVNNVRRLVAYLVEADALLSAYELVQRMPLVRALLMEHMARAQNGTFRFILAEQVRVQAKASPAMVEEWIMQQTTTYGKTLALEPFPDSFKKLFWRFSALRQPVLPYLGVDNDRTLLQNVERATMLLLAYPVLAKASVALVFKGITVVVDATTDPKTLEEDFQLALAGKVEGPVGPSPKK